MVWCHSVIRFPTMTKALLTAAGISWLYLRDENGRYTGQRELAVIVDFQSKRINGKRCAFQQRYSEQMLKHIAMHIEDFAKNTIYHFARSVVEMCKRDGLEPLDTEECVELLMQSLPKGFEEFSKGREEPWMQQYYSTLKVSRGTMYLGDDGDWHEADEDMLLIVRDPWFETASKKDVRFKLTP